MVTDCIGCTESLKRTTDARLVRLSLQGRDEAFRCLFERHEPVFSRVARSIVKNDSDAQDVVQSAFLKMVRKLETFSGEGSFAGWGYRIVQNTALMHLRSQRRRREVFWDVEPSRTDERTPYDELNDHQIREALAALVPRLEPKYRRAFELREIEGQSMEEIGEALDLSVGGAKTRLHRARGHLRVWLEHEYGLTPG